MTFRKRRVMRSLVRDRERLAALSPGGSEDHPIQVASASVIEVRTRRLACPQCEGQYQVENHWAPASGVRKLEVRCAQCSVARTLWFRIVGVGAN